ncbi:MAG: hypothetical protein RLZZ262_881 [Bacteroidota bacterium]|jgi:predicted SAM-dependent methyltransferase
MTERNLKIEIGCGKRPRPGYLTCDVRDLPTVNIVCRADELPFREGTVDEVFSRHLIEHFTLIEFLKILEDWNRVLKVGGVVYIICPNFVWHCQQVLRGADESFYNKESGKNDRYWGFGSIFGWQQDEFDIHKFGYYFTLLRDILAEFGFGNILDLTNQPNSIEKAMWHLEVRAEKTNHAIPYHQSKFFGHFSVNH